MSWEVEQAYWHWWTPGTRVAEVDRDEARFQSYLRRAGRSPSIHLLLLLALALDAQPILDVWGNSELAVTFPSVDTLAERIRRSKRSTQDYLRELEYWGELELAACTGACNLARFHHHGTNHYYLPLPEGAQPWGRKERRHGRTRKD